VLSDPDHLTAFHIDALYVHWLGRQKKGLSPFVVINGGPHHRTSAKTSQKGKEKQKVAYVDVDTDDESVQDDEDDVVEEDEDDDVEQAETEEELDPNVPAVKFGPPPSKKNRTERSTHLEDSVAGPSKGSTPNQPSTAKKSLASIPKNGPLVCLEQIQDYLMLMSA
jgi:hypothetical protein